MTPEDIAKMIADQVSKATAERAAAATDAARVANGKAVTPENLNAADMARAARAGEVVQPRATLTNDPLNGKGLDFARMVMARGVEHLTGKRAVDVAKQWGYDRVSKALSEGSFADGGLFVRDQLSAEFIELLRPAMVCAQMGHREVQFKGSMTLQRQNSAATASWIGEASNITPSGPGFAELQLQAKKLASAVVISNDLIRNPNVSLEAMVRDDLLAVMARKLDLAELEGTGSAYAPRGLDSWVASANSNNITGTALADKVSDLGRAIRLVEANDVPITRGGFVLHPRTKWALMTTLNSDGQFVFFDEMSRGSLFGYPYKTTTAMTASGSNYKIYFGSWDQLILGVDTSMEIETLMNTAYYNGSAVVAGASTDESLVRAIGRFDVVLRHDKAFSITSAVSY